MGVKLDQSAIMKTGEKVKLGDLDKEATIWVAGLGWDPLTTGAKADLDAWALMVSDDGEVNALDRVVKYDRKDRKKKVSDASGAVTYMGDSRDGEGSGDDESIRVDITKLPDDVAQIIYLVNIYKGEERDQTFGLVSNAYVRMLVEDDVTEKRNFSLTNDAGDATTVVFARLVRSGSDWVFEPVEKYTKTLADALALFGVEL